MHSIRICMTKVSGRACILPEGIYSPRVLALPRRLPLSVPTPPSSPWSTTNQPNHQLWAPSLFWTALLECNRSPVSRKIPQRSRTQSLSPCPTSQSHVISRTKRMRPWHRQLGQREMKTAWHRYLWMSLWRPDATASPNSPLRMWRARESRKVVAIVWGVVEVLGCRQWWKCRTTFAWRRRLRCQLPVL